MKSIMKTSEKKTVRSIKTKKIKKENKLKGFPGLKSLVPYYKRYRGMFFLTIFFMVMSAGIGLLAPILSANALASLSELNFDRALLFAGGVILVKITVVLFQYLQGTSYVRLDVKVVYDIKTALIRAITGVKMQKNDQTNSGIYIERLNEDAGKCSDVLMDLMIVFLDILSNIGFLIFVAFLNIWFFLALLVYVMILWVIDNKKEYIWYTQRKKFRECREISTGSYNEQIRGLRDVKSLNIRNNTIKDSGDKYNEALAVHKSSRVTRRKFILARDTIAVICEVGFFVLGLFFIKWELISLSGYLVIFMYHGNIKGLTGYFSAIKQYAIEGELAAQRIFEIIKEYPKETFGNVDLPKVHGVVEFRNVAFGYEKDKDILKNINLKFEPNTVTAIVGKSGSGKSTILNLINRLYDINSGEILLDGVNIKKLTENCLRNSVGVVSQSPYIFNRTIRENFKFIRDDVTETEMINALKNAEIYDFITSLDGGLDSLVGENGVMLSGGQKQRIAIARILCKNSPVIILDEATSALDNESQGKIVDTINNLKQNHTIIVVAHRLSTIVDADKILVLDNGAIIDEGRHNQLFRRCKVYKDLYKSEEAIDQLEEIILDNKVNDGAYEVQVVPKESL